MSWGDLSQDIQVHVGNSWQRQKKIVFKIFTTQKQENLLIILVCTNNVAPVLTIQKSSINQICVENHFIELYLTRWRRMKVDLQLDLHSCQISVRQPKQPEE